MPLFIKDLLLQNLKLHIRNVFPNAPIFCDLNQFAYNLLLSGVYEVVHGQEVALLVVTISLYDIVAFDEQKCLRWKSVKLLVHSLFLLGGLRI